MIYGYLIGGLTAAVVMLAGALIVVNAKNFTHLQALSIREFEREQAWNKERQQLLDRIQAPSFDHLKHQEAKIIKAQNEQPKEVVTLEVV